MQRRTLIASTAAVLTPALAPMAAFAQSERPPLKIMIGFPPGASIDTVARLLAEKLRDELKRPVIVESKAGAGGRLAAELLKNAAGDPNLLMLCPIVVPVLAPLVFSKLNYNPVTDFVPVAHVSSFNFALTVSASNPAKNVKELIAWYKANPKSANYGSPAAGSLAHFFGLLVGKESGVDVQHLSYNGGAPLQVALLGDQVPAGIDVELEFLQNHKAGKFRVIATSGRTRSKVLPDVASFTEQGFPSITGGGWFSMYATRGTSSADIDTYNRAINKALAMPDVAEKFLALGLEPGRGSAADLASLMVADKARWEPIVKASGFKAD